MSKIHPQKVFASLLIAIFILFLIHLGTFILISFYGLEPDNTLYIKTNFDKEKNLPSIFSSLLLLTASVLLAIIGFSRLSIKEITKFWISLSVVFLFVALDELLRIHEKIGGFTSSKIETSGIFHYSWVIPYGIAMIVLALLLVKPFLELPKKVFYGFIISAGIFLTGAVGIEMFTGWYIEYRQIANENINILPDIFILYTIEELLEMIGVSYFIFTLLKFLKKNRVE